MNEYVEQLKETLSRAKQEVGKVIIGQESVIDYCLIVIFTGNHALIEGVPGVAKTLLVRTLAKVLGGDFSRIQFTPDLMPADITGTEVFNMKTNEFDFHMGPIFTSFLLADEINRAPAKTQSALLQAMQEWVVSISRKTYTLPENFTVFATQNPVEYEGTYPLPEAQKDRFMLKIDMDYPEHEDEMELAKRMLGDETPEKVLNGNQVHSVISIEDLSQCRHSLQAIVMREDLVDYVVKVVRATREHAAVLTGAGPRATQALIAASRGIAALNGNDFVSPDDIRSIAQAVLVHRVIVRPEYEIEGLTSADVIKKILTDVPVPR
ncbi:MAG: MoxR family ATPase [Verrucomicrobiota bacterium]